VSSLQKFRSWIGASRQRFALFFAFWMSVWMLAIEIVRHSEHGAYAYLVRVTVPAFVISYLVVLLIRSGPRSKRPS
jgi:hypothetical protein